MRSVSRLTVLPLVASLLLGAGACAAAAVGAAGAAGATYYSDRGAESIVAASVAETAEATRKAFEEFNVTETKARSDQGDGKATRVIEGETPDREVTATITTEGSGSKVEIVARKSAVTWDKDLAKAILERVVALAGRDASA
jgi:hypothetical protein